MHSYTRCTQHVMCTPSEFRYVLLSFVVAIYTQTSDRPCPVRGKAARVRICLTSLHPAGFYCLCTCKIRCKMKGPRLDLAVYAYTVSPSLRGLSRAVLSSPRPFACHPYTVHRRSWDAAREETDGDGMEGWRGRKTEGQGGMGGPESGLRVIRGVNTDHPPLQDQECLVKCQVRTLFCCVFCRGVGGQRGTAACFVVCAYHGAWRTRKGQTEKRLPASRLFPLVVGEKEVLINTSGRRGLATHKEGDDAERGKKKKKTARRSLALFLP